MNFIKFKAFILALLLSVIALSYLVFDKLSLSLYPNSTKPTIRVQVFYEMDVLNFRENIGKKMEQSFKTLSGVVNLDAQYQPGRTTYYVKFDWGIDSLEAYQDAASSAALYQSMLPANAPKIKASYYDPGLELYVAVESKHHSAEHLSQMIKQKLEPRIKNIKGISSVYVSPVLDKEVSIKVSPHLLAVHNLTMKDITMPLQDARFDFSLGTIQASNQSPEFRVVYENHRDTVTKLRTLPIQIAQGKILRLSDIARVTLQTRPQDRVFRVDDKRVIAIAAWPLPNADIYKIASQFQQEVKQALANNASVKVINSPINYIDESIEQMAMAIALGMLFAGLSVALAFRKLSLTLLIAITMPLSIALSVCVLYMLGVGVNIITISAAGIAIGMVIDPAVFIVDRVTRDLTAPENKALAVETIIVSAVKKCRASVLSTTFSTLAVFLPLIFTQPVVKALLGDFVIVITSLLLASLFISLLVIPVALLLVAHNIKAKAKPPKAQAQASGKWLSWHFVTLPFVLGVAALAWMAFTLLSSEVKREIVAQPLPNIVDIGMSFSSNELTFEQRNRLVTPIYTQVREKFSDRIKFVFSDIRKDVAYLSIHLSYNRDIEGFITQLKREIKSTQDYDIDISPWVSASLKVEDIPSARISVAGAEHASAINTLDRLSRFLREQDAVMKIKTYPRTRSGDIVSVALKDEVLSWLDNEQEYQAYLEQINALIRYAATPELAYEVSKGNQILPVMLQLGKNRTQALDELKNLPLNIQGKIYKMSDILEFKVENKHSQFFSRNASNMYLIEIWLDKSVTKPVDFIHSRLQQLDDLDINALSIHSTRGEIEQNVVSLVYALYGALALVVLVLLLDLVRIPYMLIALLNLPSGLIGAAFALYYFDSTLSVTSLIGLIMLAGLSVNNTIFIIHGLRQLADSHPELSPAQRVMGAVKMRLNSVLVTSASTLFAMLPLAYGYGNSGPITQPLGLVMCGGIFSATFLSLTLSPIFLYWFEKWQHRPYAEPQTA